MFIVKPGARGAAPGGGEGPGSCHCGGSEEAGRLAPRRGAEEAVRHMAAAVDVDGRHEGCISSGRRRRGILCSARDVHGAGRPAEESARRRLPHHHQAAERFLAPGLRKHGLVA